MHVNPLKKPLLLTSFAALIALSGACAAATSTGFLYVSDYGDSNLDRYKYTLDSITNQMTFSPFGKNGNVTDAFFLGDVSSAPVKEGIHGATNDIILVGGSHSSGETVFTRYDFNGNLIGAGTIPVDFVPLFHTTDVGIGNTLITKDGKFLYAPLEKVGAIVKIDLANGAIVANFGFAGAHDVAIALNGDVYAANYSAGGAKVIRLDANLSAATDLITSTPAGVGGGFRPSGLSITQDGGKLVVQNNTQGGFDSILNYTLSSTAGLLNSGGVLSATYDPDHSYIGNGTNNALEFTFGNNIGPDGKIYIAALGGGGTHSFSTRTGYEDGIYVFDPTVLNSTVSLVIAGYTEGASNGAGTASANGLTAPKYLQFDTNFAPNPDAGVPVPELSGSWFIVALGCACVMNRRGFVALRRI